MPRSIPIAFGALCRRLRARAWGAFPIRNDDSGAVHPGGGLKQGCSWVASGEVGAVALAYAGTIRL